MFFIIVDMINIVLSIVLLILTIRAWCAERYFMELSKRLRKLYEQADQHNYAPRDKDLD